MPLESAKPWENLETKRFYNFSENTHFQQRTNKRTLRSLLAGDEQVTQQILNIQPMVHPNQNQAQMAQPASLEGSSQTFSPGDKVGIKVDARKNVLSPKCKEPSLVLPTSFSVIKAEGRDSWIPHSHVKTGPDGKNSS